VSYAVIACRALLALVFLVSMLGKVRNRALFAASLRDLRTVPASMVSGVALAVIVCEAVIPVLLAVPGTVVPGFVLAGAMLAAFIVVIGVSVGRGSAVPCPCFGAGAEPLGGRHIVRNTLLLAAAVAGILLAPRPAPDAEAAGILLALVAAAVLAALIVRMDDLIELFTGAPTVTGPPARRS
jgi:hypothetical protein